MQSHTRRYTSLLASLPVLGMLFIGSFSGAVSAKSSPAATGTAAGGVNSGPLKGLGLSAAQTHAELELNGRLTKLNNLQARVASDTTLTTSDRSSIDAIITYSQNGMHTLISDVESATTVKAVWQDEITMVQDYRVYLVVAPQVDLTLANDKGAAILSKLTALEPKISQVISNEQQLGKNVSGAQAAFSAYESEVTDISTDLQSVSSSTLLAETPSDYPASTPVFENALTSLQSARSSAISARSDLETIVNDL